MFITNGKMEKTKESQRERLQCYSKKSVLEEGLLRIKCSLVCPQQSWKNRFWQQEVIEEVWTKHMGCCKKTHARKVDCINSRTF